MLDVTELSHALNLLGSMGGGKPFTDIECARFLEGYDDDNSGTLDADEFSQVRQPGLFELGPISHIS